MSKLILSVFHIFIFPTIDDKNTLKQLLCWLIDGSKVDGSVPTSMLDSLTMLEYLKLNEKLKKLSPEKSIAHIAMLCERMSYFPEKTVEER